MKKSLIAIAVSAAVAVPAIASADVTLSGDTRVRMHQDELNVSGGPDAIEASTNTRVRLHIDAKGDGYYLHSRVVYDDKTLGGSTKAVAADYAWLGVELGPVLLEGGRLNDNWGNRLTSWDVNWDGIQASFSAGAVDIALWRSTNVEGGTYDKKGLVTTHTKDSDDISYGADFTGKAGMGNWGLRVTSDNAGASSSAVKSVSGTTIDAFYRGQVGPGMILAQGVQRSGDYWKMTAGMPGESPSSPQALYVHWIQNMGKFYYQVAGVQTSNYFSADKHFGPFSTVGTAQDTALMDVGGMKSMTIIGLFAGMQIMPMTTVQLGLGSMDAKPVYGAQKGGATAIDLQLTYKVSKAAKLTATYGTLDMDKKLGDMKYTAMGARADVKF